MKKLDYLFHPFLLLIPRHLLALAPAMFPALALLMLASCVSMNSDFDCPMKPGVVCKSLDQVNSMVDSGQIGHDQYRGNICPTCKKSKQLTPFSTPFNRANNTATTKTNASLLSTGTHTPPAAMKIWVAPYQDLANNWHGEKIIYTNR